MAVDEKAGNVIKGAKFGRAGRVVWLTGGRDVNRAGNVVKLTIPRDRDPGLPSAVAEALEKLPEYLYRG